MFQASPNDFVEGIEIASGEEVGIVAGASSSASPSAGALVASVLIIAAFGFCRRTDCLPVLALKLERKVDQRLAAGVGVPSAGLAVASFVSALCGASASVPAVGVVAAASSRLPTLSVAAVVGVAAVSSGLMVAAGVEALIDTGGACVSVTSGSRACGSLSLSMGIEEFRSLLATASVDDFVAVGRLFFVLVFDLPDSWSCFLLFLIFGFGFASMAAATSANKLDPSDGLLVDSLLFFLGFFNPSLSFELEVIFRLDDSFDGPNLALLAWAHFFAFSPNIFSSSVSSRLLTDIDLLLLDEPSTVDLLPLDDLSSMDPLPLDDLSSMDLVPLEEPSTRLFLILEDVLSSMDLLPRDDLLSSMDLLPLEEASSFELLPSVLPLEGLVPLSLVLLSSFDDESIALLDDFSYVDLRPFDENSLSFELFSSDDFGFVDLFEITCVFLLAFGAVGESPSAVIVMDLVPLVVPLVGVASLSGDLLVSRTVLLPLEEASVDLLPLEDLSSSDLLPLEEASVVDLLPLDDLSSSVLAPLEDLSAVDLSPLEDLSSSVLEPLEDLSAGDLPALDDLSSGDLLPLDETSSVDLLPLEERSSKVLASRCDLPFGDLLDLVPESPPMVLRPREDLSLLPLDDLSSNDDGVVVVRDEPSGGLSAPCRGLLTGALSRVSERAGVSKASFALTRDAVVGEGDASSCTSSLFDFAVSLASSLVATDVELPSRID